MNDKSQNAFLGSLVADAVAMPVHWIYDTTAMDLQYGEFEGYEAPQSPHPDSILWRSTYSPRNEKAEILHGMAKYWGQPGVHYHQFLEAGENTINYLLAIQLYRSTVRIGRYDADEWLETYIKLMQTPGWHQDTYLEEYHRAFFDRLAAGKRPRKCGIEDFHIGGLAQVPALIAALD
ncbi:MAG: ADP-ribosylglycohydrolase family protein, partial [Verrucomicrobiota bacterium]